MTQLYWDDYTPNAIATTEAELAAFETAVGATFPDDLRRLFTEHAGQVVEPESLDLGRGSTILGPIHYLSQHEEGSARSENAWVALRWLRAWLEDDQAAVVPFSTNQSTAKFFVDLRAGGDGRVKLADRSLDIEEDGAITDLASGISQLLKLLHD